MTDREELVRATLDAIAAHDAEPGDETPIRDRLLAEIYATCFQLEGVLDMMVKQGPSGIMKMMLGMRRRKAVEPVEEEAEHGDEEATG